MLGKVYSTIKQKDNGISDTLQTKIKAYESIATDLLNSVKSVEPHINYKNEEEKEIPLEMEKEIPSPEPITDSCKTRKSKLHLSD